MRLFDTLPPDAILYDDVVCWLFRPTHTYVWYFVRMLLVCIVYMCVWCGVKQNDSTCYNS